MRFVNMHDRSDAVLTPNSHVSRDIMTGLISYFGETGLQLEPVKEHQADPALGGQTNDFDAFRTRAMTAAAKYGLKIEPVNGADAFIFVKE